MALKTNSRFDLIVVMVIFRKDNYNFDFDEFPDICWQCVFPNH